MDQPKGNLGIHRLWSSPFTPRVQGGLRETMNQYSDPSGNILTPKRQPESKRRGAGDGFKVIPIDPEVTPDACVPPFSGGDIVQTGGSTPLALGENITLSATLQTGVTSPSYQWYLNGNPTATTEDYAYTVADGDIVGRDATGLGSIQFFVAITNDCGAVVLSGGFPAQGTPPP